jgi:hypothetical protein
MGKKDPEESIAQPGGSIGPPMVEPLAHQGCKRLPQVEKQIREAIALEDTALIQRTKQRDETASTSLSRRDHRPLLSVLEVPTSFVVLLLTTDNSDIGPKS